MEKVIYASDILRAFNITDKKSLILVLKKYMLTDEIEEALMLGYHMAHGYFPEEPFFDLLKESADKKGLEMLKDSWRIRKKVHIKSLNETRQVLRDFYKKRKIEPHEWLRKEYDLMEEK